MKTSISGSMSDWPAEDADLAEAAEVAELDMPPAAPTPAATEGDPPDCCCSDVDWLVAACRKIIS